MSTYPWKTETNKYTYVDDFIENHCNTVRDLSKSHAYISFSLICSGIEFLGKCLDETRDFNTFGAEIGRTQFDNAITQLMPKYQHLQGTYNLYTNMRNGMVHSLIPSKKYWLRESHNTNYKHLSEQQIQGRKRIVFIIDEFYKDFETACNEVIRRIRTNAFYHAKMQKPFMVFKE
jgi:hypothetical protein